MVGEEDGHPPSVEDLRDGRQQERYIQYEECGGGDGHPLVGAARVADSETRGASLTCRCGGRRVQGLREVGLGVRESRSLLLRVE